MKGHTFFRVISKAAVLLALFTLVSCQNGLEDKYKGSSVKQKARIVVAASAKTNMRQAVDPDLSLSKFSDFKLYATTQALPDDLTILTPIATGDTVEELNDPAIELDAGVWNFHLIASLNGVTFSGSVSNFEASSTVTNTISFTLTPEITGGGLEVKITFPSQADKVHVTLEPVAGGTAVIDEDATTFETSGSNKSLTISRDISDNTERIAPGTYLLSYAFYENDITEALNTCEFIVNIASGITTTKTDFAIADLNETHTITYQYKYFTVGKETGETIDVSSLLTEDDGPIVLPVKYFRKSNISNTNLPVLKNYTVDGKTYSFAGWYDGPDINYFNHRCSKCPDTGSDITLVACFTDTIYVSESTNHISGDFTTGFSSAYPCFALSDAVDSIQRFNEFKTIDNADSNVDWKIIIDGQTSGAELKNISGKSLTLQGKTGSDTDILDGNCADLADDPDTLDVGAVLTVQTGFPVYISKLKITHGGRAIGVYPGKINSSTPNTPTELTLQSDTKIENNIGGGEAGAIYLFGDSSTVNVILNIETGVVISNNISRAAGSAAGLGGAIGADGYSVINMSGGEITNNTAYNWGGAICLFGSHTTLNLSGGTISGNDVSYLGTTPNSDGQKGGAIYKAANATLNIQSEVYIPYADNKNDIYLAGGAINLSGEIFNYDNQLQEFAITIADPTETSRIVLTQSDEGGKYVMGFHQMFIPTVAGYEIGSDGKWAASTNTPYTVKHYKQPDNGSTTLANYELADTENKTGTTGATTSASAKTYTGFTSQTFSQSTIAGDGLTVVNIYYNRKTITYTFNKGSGEWTSGSETGSKSGLYGTTFTPPATTRTGYNFGTWKTDSDEELASPYTFGAQNKTYNAYWTPINYTITYELDGGTNHTDNPSTYTILSEITFKTPTKANAVFGGWYTDSSFTTAITEIPLGTYEAPGADPLTLYAKWQYNQDFEATIDPGAGSTLSMTVTVAGTEVADGETISVAYSAASGSTIVFTPTFTQAGYTCVWKIDEETTMTGMSVTDNVLTVNTTGWLPGLYDVQLTASKGSGTSAVYEAYYTQIVISAL
ncbi:MAG: InlB B-repeat-containing protein [Treponema sp.]|nr:InlB B-repeat-containing protein [Treponema sp.]